MYYVSMTDVFMSFWGCAEDKTNKLVLACATSDEADIVAQNAKDRGEMRNICIHAKKPCFTPKSCHLVSWHDRSDYDRWYQDDRPFLD